MVSLKPLLAINLARRGRCVALVRGKMLPELR
jgi:hypothetical protein